MKRTITILLMTAALAALASTAFAHSVTPRVDRRQVRQEARIRDGVRSGELTRGETRRLVAGQRHVARVERRAKADGHVTARERAHLNRAQNVQSRHIYRLKHNGVTR